MDVPPELFLEGYPPPHREIAGQLRRVVQLAVPDARERVRVGWRVLGYDVPVGRRTRFFCWIFPEREHVHLGFVNGVLMPDPDGVLEGSGVTKLARWVTFRPGDEVVPAPLVTLVRGAAEVAVVPPSARRVLSG